jgi:hypothetical protein
VQRLHRQNAVFDVRRAVRLSMGGIKAIRVPGGARYPWGGEHRCGRAHGGKALVALSFAVNWVGVIVGNVALLVIGFVWFMPNVFGNRWIALMGRPGEQLRPGPDFVLSILSGTLNSFVMAVLALNLKATTVGDGVLLGLVVWAGFFLSYMTANTVFAKRSWTLWGIDVGHALLAQVVLAVIVTLLR